MRDALGRGTLVLAFIVGMAASATSASGAVLYSQPGSAAACASSCWTSSVGTKGVGFQTYDNFTLSQTSKITGVQWQGFYFDFVDSANNPPAPPTTSWQFSFSANNAGLPGAVLQSQTLLVGSVTATFLGNSTFGSFTVPVYHFSAALPTPFIAVGGTELWFSPLSQQPSYNPIFSWSPALVDVDPTATGTAQTVLPVFAPYFQPNDRNFELDGFVSVPEPSSLLLLGAGLFGFSSMRRRKAKA